MTRDATAGVCVRYVSVSGRAFSLYLVWCRVESTYIVDRMVYYYLILHERGQAHGSAAGKATRNKDGRKDN